MGIYLPNMEMPISCGDCPCGSVLFGYKCTAENKVFEKYPLDGRQDWCPLIPVPEPHGKLIDEKDICDKMRPLIEITYKNSGLLYGYNRSSVISETLGYCLQIIRDAPAIIPAEEDE